MTAPSIPHLLVVLLNVPVLGWAESELDFNRDVRPILSDNCFHCHGPDAKNQKSDFRLDTQEQIFADLGGYFGVKPGSLDDSELHWRIHDEEDPMPPADSNRSLSKREKEILDRWIKEGAPYDKHWAFKVPQRPEVPTTKGNWGANPIDSFILERLEAEGMKPSDRATRETLLRRASLTLTGLVPTPEAMKTFLADDSPDAFTKQIERMIATTDYAERQTLRWLDAARFADTDGYQNDAERSNWPWRDWVIQAFHENKPFDEFTIEQIAGDMLPNATNDQILASAFNRNHRQNSEGGALAEEFFVENVIDRVETTSTVFLGLTMGCARCHDHKYDPLSQKEFFQMYAYFNNIGERGTGKGISANPILRAASPLVELPQEMVTKKQAAEAEVREARKGIATRRQAWTEKLVVDAEGGEIEWTPTDVINATSSEGSLSPQEDGTWVIEGKTSKPTYKVELAPGETTVTALKVDALTDPSFSKPRQLSRSSNGNFVLTEVELRIDGKPVALGEASATFAQSTFPASNVTDGNPNSGWAVFDKAPGDVSLLLKLVAPLEVTAQSRLTLTLHHNTHYAAHNIGKFRILQTDRLQPRLEGGAPNRKLIAAARIPAKERDRGQAKLINDEFTKQDAPVLEAQKRLDAINKNLAAKGLLDVPVMVMQEREGEPMPAYLLNRGSYLEPDTSEAMTRQMPAALFSGADPKQPTNRLELAQWLVSRDNPLTARVIVNRIWQSIFGVGLVKTVEDFGLQGEIPSHPELLDWLAVEFMESGWDLGGLYSLILTSETFRQSSVSTPEMREADPENRLVARGPRFRMDGFALRDMALHSAGLLDERVGGQPVKPYQPEGLWNAVAGRANIRYEMGRGGDLYRKSLYTYWKRAVNPPRQIIFDAAGREACNVNSRVTNTPLQALVLMNDVTFVEAARNLAERGLKTEAVDPVAEIYQLATSRQAAAETLAVLNENLAWFEAHFSTQPEATETFLSMGESPRDEQLDPVEHAAHAAVAHLILNLDETITLE